MSDCKEIGKEMISVSFERKSDRCSQLEGSFEIQTLQVSLKHRYLTVCCLFDFGSISISNRKSNEMNKSTSSPNARIKIRNIEIIKCEVETHANILPEN